VYLPTNGRLMRPEVIDRVLDAGVATINLAVDAVYEKPGLPKALNPIRRNFDYLVRRQYAYGTAVFFNINICRNNLEDVKALTEIARENGIATDYHINEEPMIEPDHFSHLKENPTYIRREDWPKIDEVLDWLIEKNRSGYKMVNSTARLADMKKFMRRAAIVGLPGWPELDDHPRRRFAGALLPHVFLSVRLGNRGMPQVR
jgi:MoaA/NifB/PqqE/SkfB family radical SAM enzyme